MKNYILGGKRTIINLVMIYHGIKTANVKISMAYTQKMAYFLP